MDNGVKEIIIFRVSLNWWACKASLPNNNYQVLATSQSVTIVLIAIAIQRINSNRLLVEIAYRLHFKQNAIRRYHRD